MAFSRPEYWNGLRLPSPGDLPDPGMEPRSLTLQADSSPSEPHGSPTEYQLQLNLKKQATRKRRVTEEGLHHRPSRSWERERERGSHHCPLYRWENWGEARKIHSSSAWETDAQQPCFNRLSTQGGRISLLPSHESTLHISLGILLSGKNLGN